jgi:hypothetical protein
VGETEAVSLVVTALASGASAALKDSAGAAVKSAYEALRRLVRRKLRGRAQAEAALQQHEAEPDLCQQALRQELALADAGSDEEIVRAANELLALLDLHRRQKAGKYSVEIHGAAQGTVIGDHAEVAQSFGSRPTQP